MTDPAGAAPMPAAALARLRDSYAVLAADRDHVARMFYHRLRTAAPDLAPLFQEDDTRRGRAVFAAFGALIVGLEDLGCVMPLAADLGRGHARMGVEPEHYAAFADAWIWTVRQVQGAACDAETEAAWRTFHRLIAAAMTGRETVSA